MLFRGKSIKLMPIFHISDVYLNIFKKKGAETSLTFPHDILADRLKSWQQHRVHQVTEKCTPMCDQKAFLEIR